MKFEKCEGTLSWGANSLKLPFDLIVSRNGEIRIDFGSQPLTHENIWIEIAFSQKKPTAEFLKLEGATSEGYAIESDSIVLTKSGISSDHKGSLIAIEATAARVDIRVVRDAIEPPYEATADFLIAGLQCFRVGKIDHDLGEILIAGPTEVDDYSEIRGFVSLRKRITGSDSFESWLESATEQAKRIRHLLSFANGRLLKTSILRVYQDKTLSSLTLYGRASDSRPYRPPFSFLHLRPIIELGLERYTKDLIDETGMDVALEWHLMPHAYSEDRYLAQITALEHLVHVFRERRPSNRVIEKSKFRNIVRPALEKRLDELVSELGNTPQERDRVTDTITELKGRLGNLNMQSLQSSLRSMLQEYLVPLDGLDGLIQDLINVRNEIVHRGLYEGSADQKSLIMYLSAAEELVRRVFLSLLEYEGNYQTYFTVSDSVPFKRLPSMNKG